MRTDQACDAFLTHCRLARNLSDHTLRAYGADLAEFQGFFGPEKPISDYDRDDLRAFLDKLFSKRKLKAASIKRRMACLKAMFRWLELEEVIPITPFHRLDLRIRLPKSLPKSLSATELQRLFTTALSRGLPPLFGKETFSLPAFDAATNLVALEILFETGIRIGELTALRLNDIDFETGTITIQGKGDRERRVFLTDRETLTRARQYLNLRKTADPTGKSQAFLLTPRGTPIKDQRLRKLLRETAKAAKIERHITPHMLRHSTATHLLASGVDIRFVQRLLGHQSIATTQIYTHVEDTGLREVMENANVRRRARIDN